MRGTRQISVLGLSAAQSKELFLFSEKAVHPLPQGETRAPRPAAPSEKMPCELDAHSFCAEVRTSKPFFSREVSVLYRKKRPLNRKIQEKPNGFAKVSGSKPGTFAVPLREGWVD